MITEEKNTDHLIWKEDKKVVTWYRELPEEEIVMYDMVSFRPNGRDKPGPIDLDTVRYVHDTHLSLFGYSAYIDKKKCCKVVELQTPNADHLTPCQTNYLP